jgi:nicotinamide-nucleotide amidase
MNPKVEIFSQGEEVVTGQIADTNAAWLSQQLVTLGFQVSRHTAVGDKMLDLVGLLQEIANRADCCICTGGLGPTRDDLTAEAVAQAFNLPLQLDELALQHISRYFQNRNSDMPVVNRKQALLPQGAIRLDNHYGTAPGFCLQYQKCWFVFLPGVPSEMKPLFSETVKTHLQNRFSLNPEKLITLRTFGMGESALQERIDQLNLPESVTLGYRAALNEVQIKLLFPADYPIAQITECSKKIAAHLGNSVFAIDGLDKPAGDLIGVIAELLEEKSQTLAVIETASQGLIAAKCLGHDWLVASYYEQSTARVSETFPSVVDNTANFIATALRLGRVLQGKIEVDFVLVQLYDGNRQRFADNDQTISLYTVLITEQGFCQQIKTLGGSLERKQNHAALTALDLLRRFLQQKEPLCPYYD